MNIYQYKELCDFPMLTKSWTEEVMFSSSNSELHDSKAYNKIISMGMVAVPYILRDLIKNYNHWFLALHKITGAKPVPYEDRGRIARMAEHWYNWGKEQGLV